MSSSIDLPFIDETGLSINEILNDDQQQSEWLNNCISQISQSKGFPEGSIDHIIDFLSSVGTEECLNLIAQINRITSDEDNKENLLNAIFYPQTGFDDQNEEEEEDIFIPPEEEEEIMEVDGELTPVSYFLQIMYQFKTPLYLSNDISYLILKMHGWNKESANNAWLENQESILKKLHLKIGSEMIPDLQSSLTIRKIDSGQCPICHNDKALLQLYCGHTICKECLNAEIKAQLDQNKLPFCHQKTTDDNTDCNSEIILNRSIIDHELFQTYKHVLIHDKLENNTIFVRACPNSRCGWYITIRNRIGEDTGICSHCKAFTCLRCHNGSHYPLSGCSKIEEFNKTIPDQMIKLYSDHYAWVKREESLKSCRCTQKDNIAKVLDDTIKDLTEWHKKETMNDQIRIKQVDDNIEQSNKEIEEIKKKIREYVSQKRHISDFSPLTQRIIILREEIEKRQIYKKQIEKEITGKENLWNSFLKSAKSDNKILLNGLINPTTYQKNLNNFNKAQNQHAYEKIEINNENFELIDLLSVPCPKCEEEARNLIGINQINCECGFNICLVCGKEWDKNHQLHFACPNYMLNLESAKDAKDPYQPKDTNFYKPPMPLNKRIDFILFNNFYAQHQRQKEIYDEMEQDFAQTEDKNSNGFNLDSPDEDLCPTNRLRRCFEQNTSQTESKKLAANILNTVLFAQSILTWGYPAMYFYRIKNNTRESYSIQINILNAKKYQSNLIDMIKKPSSYRKEDFLREYESLESAIKKILVNQ